MGRIVRPADFQRVLGTPPWARSVHFAVHHLPQAPSKPAFSTARSTELSTGQQQTFPPAVDESAIEPPPLMEALVISTCWLGMVVPKRNAKRSVTRSLIKRQIRAAVGAVQADDRPHGLLHPGLWVVRLRAPIDRKRFPSAASDALRSVMHDELAQVMARAVQRCHG